MSDRKAKVWHFGTSTPDDGGMGVCGQRDAWTKSRTVMLHDADGAPAPTKFRDQTDAASTRHTETTCEACKAHPLWLAAYQARQDMLEHVLASRRQEESGGAMKIPRHVRQRANQIALIEFPGSHNWGGADSTRVLRRAVRDVYITGWLEAQNPPTETEIAEDAERIRKSTVFSSPSDARSWGCGAVKPPESVRFVWMRAYWSIDPDRWLELLALIDADKPFDLDALGARELKGRPRGKIEILPPRGSDDAMSDRRHGFGSGTKKVDGGFVAVAWNGRGLRLESCVLTTRAAAHREARALLAELEAREASVA